MVALEESAPHDLGITSVLNLMAVHQIIVLFQSLPKWGTDRLTLPSLKPQEPTTTKLYCYCVALLAMVQQQKSSWISRLYITY